MSSKWRVLMDTKPTNTHGPIQEVHQFIISPGSVKSIIIHLLEKYQTKRQDGRPWDFSISSISRGTGLSYETVRRAVKPIRKAGLLKLHGWLGNKTHPIMVFLFHPEALPQFLLKYKKIEVKMSQKPKYNKIDDKTLPISSVDNQGLTQETPQVYNKIDDRLLPLIDDRLLPSQEDGVQEQELLSIKEENTYPNTNVSTYPSGDNFVPLLSPSTSSVSGSVSQIYLGNPSSPSPNPSTGNLADEFEAFFHTSSSTVGGGSQVTPPPPRQYHDRDYMTSIPPSSTLGRYDTLGGAINKPL